MYSKQKLKKIKAVSDELNDVIQNFETKNGMDPEELKNWIFAKYEELGNLITQSWS